LVLVDDGKALHVRWRDSSLHLQIKCLPSGLLASFAHEANHLFSLDEVRAAKGKVQGMDQAVIVPLTRAIVEPGNVALPSLHDHARVILEGVKLGIEESRNEWLRVELQPLSFIRAEVATVCAGQEVPVLELVGDLQNEGEVITRMDLNVGLSHEWNEADDVDLLGLGELPDDGGNLDKPILSIARSKEGEAHILPHIGVFQFGIQPHYVGAYQFEVGNAFNILGILGELCGGLDQCPL